MKLAREEAMKPIENGKYAIDARMIEESGIGTYIRMMIRTGNYTVCLGNEEKIRRYDDKVEVIPFEEKIYSIREQIKYPYAQLRKKGITVLHAPHYNVPLFWNRKLFVTIHDLIHLRFPQYLPNKFAYIYAWGMMKFACVRAMKIFTVSDYTKMDLINTLHAKKEKIEITYNTIEECFKKKEKSEIMYLRKKYGISDDSRIILYVGNIKPHKNIKALIEAFSLFHEADVNLILVGKSFKKQGENKWNTDGIDAEKIIMTGAVSKDELIDWYNLADVFVFPSLYEGFGIPPLEAMACGTPVVCSSSSSLPEVVGEAAVMIDPNDSVEIYQGIKAVLDASVEQRDRLISNGYKQVSLFRKQV